MKLVNMKMSAEEASEQYGSSLAEAPKYPYGLSLNLDDDALEKLGLDEDLPEVGESFLVMCKVDVVSVISRSDQEGESEDSIRLQITDMAFDKPFDDSDPQDKLYGK